MVYEIRRARTDDVVYMASRLRRADLDEIKAATGRGPLSALEEGYRHGPAWVGAHGGKPFMIWGVVPLNLGYDCHAAPWMLATDGLLSHAREVAKRSREEVNKLFGWAHVLTNCVDARNTVHIRWLRWCGFSFLKIHERFGHEQRPFYEFIKYRNV